MGTLFKIVVSGNHDTSDVNYKNEILRALEPLKSNSVYLLSENRSSRSILFSGIYRNGFIQDIHNENDENLLLWVSKNWGVKIKVRSITTSESDEEYLIYNKGVVEKEDSYVIYDDEADKAVRSFEKF